MYRGMAALLVVTSVLVAPGARGEAADAVDEPTRPTIEPAALEFVQGQSFVSRAPVVEPTTVTVTEPAPDTPAAVTPTPVPPESVPPPPREPARPPEAVAMSAPVQSSAAAPPAAPPAQAVAQPACAGAAMSAQAAALLQALNAERTGRGLAALSTDPCASQVASVRAYDLATRRYFSHTSPDGSTAGSLLAGLGLSDVPSAENLARNNYQVAESVGVAIRDLIASPPHRGAILNGAHTHVGVASADDGDGMSYYVMVFLAR